MMLLHVLYSTLIHSMYVYLLFHALYVHEQGLSSGCVRAQKSKHALFKCRIVHVYRKQDGALLKSQITTVCRISLHFLHMYFYRTKSYTCTLWSKKIIIAPFFAISIKCVDSHRAYGILLFKRYIFFEFEQVIRVFSVSVKRLHTLVTGDEFIRGKDAGL